MIIPYGVIQRNVISFLVLFCSAINYHGAVPNYENEFVEPAPKLVVVEGLIAKLPCDITPSFRGDKIHIVIWYKKSNNGKLTPIYTFDSRGNFLLEEAKHWSDELVLGGRAHFRFQDEPAKLVINSILRNDAGVYQCRVDFKQSPTRLSKVNLTVIVPPSELTILNEKGFQVIENFLGPYKEGSSVNVTCICTGGFPSPKVTWWLENALLDESYENLSENIVRNVLHIERIERKHLDVVLTCQASNNYVVAPISTSKKLDVTLRPVSVKLLQDNRPLSAGKTYQLKCEVVGARPIPLISWWKGAIKLSNSTITVNTNGNSTISTIHFIPTLNDEGKYISCIVEQPLISTDIIETRWKLNIHHVPLVSLELSNKLSTIEEGKDVYFECNIKSNPWVYKLSWKHNGKMLYSNRTQGIIINNQSLVLQDVSRDKSGIYTCIGSNQEGDGESNAIRIEIIFAPVCRTRETVMYGVSLYETVKINCEVEAKPLAIEFAWELNNTEVSSHLTSFDETSNSILFRPLTKNDYGTLFCTASNAVGKQKEPCVFSIIYIDKPNPLSNCSVLNQTYQSLIVKCADRLDSGDENQTFVAEVYEIQTRKLLKNISSVTPTFIITGLIQNQEMGIDLYVSSEKGRSKTTHLNAFIQKLEETLAASVPVKLYITPKLSITICAVLVIMFTTVVILTACRLCGRDKHNNKKCNNRGPSSSNSHYAEEDNIENTNPDIIPLRTAKGAKGQEEEGFVDELLQNSSSETYIKLEGPEEINTRMPKLQSHLRYTTSPYSPHYLPQHRIPYPNGYGAEADLDLSASIPEESIPLHFQGHRNALQPLIGDRSRRTPRAAVTQQHRKVTQI